ncbi:MAG: FadR/GntR family transcriptional regulator [Rubrivivax sp.]
MPLPNPAQALRDALLAQIMSGDWPPGQRLPTERALSLEYGIGRSVVRRVLAELKRERLITQTVGSGTYVAAVAPSPVPASDAAFAVDAADVSPAELMAARIAIEPALVEMVIAHATPADFARMDECNDRAEAAQTLEAFELWDARLHEAIADAAHNAFVGSMQRLMNQVRSQETWAALKRRSVTPQRRLQYQQDHRALVEALRQRDLDAAREACTCHLQRVRANMLGL